MVNYNRLKQIEHLIRFNTIKDNPGIIYGQINDNYIFICEAKHESNWREETLKKIFNLEAIKETSANHIICLISRVINNPIQLQNEYKRLNDALKIVRQLTNKNLYIITMISFTTF